MAASHPTPMRANHCVKWGGQRRKLGSTRHVARLRWANNFRRPEPPARELGEAGRRKLRQGQSKDSYASTTIDEPRMAREQRAVQSCR